MSATAEKGTVSIHGKIYKTVAARVAEFREKYPDYSIVTELVSADDERVVVRADILRPHKLVSADDWTNYVLVEPEVIARGYAEEVRDSSNINKTSALENCETSAVGRALAFFGLAGTEIASADEVANAIKQQHDKAAIEYMNLVREHWESIEFIKTSLAHEEHSAALEAWRELGNEVMTDLWKAPTKGGVFTTLERKQLKEAAADAETERLKESA